MVLSDPIKDENEVDTLGFKRFQKAIGESNKLVNIVLRTHLLCEYYLDQIINAKIPRGYCLLEDNRTTFSYKLKILKSLNFLTGVSYLLDSAAGLNKVRNNCSHTLEYAITESDIDKIGLPFDKRYLKIRQNNSEDYENLLINTLALLISSMDAISQTIINDEIKKLNSVNKA